MNMCGRGDKDIFTIADELKIKNIMTNLINECFRDSDKN